LTIPIRVAAGAAFLALLIGATPDVRSAPPASHPPATGDEQPRDLPPIAVTGYHLRRMDIEGPAPVAVYNRQDLLRAGINTLEEFARLLPMNWLEPTLHFRTVGAAGFDLRGIGIDTTLTLVNGLRIAPYAQSAENYIDVNAIPVSAIERIEILKDGASAVYGADAIAGVVNIILRQGFEGLEVNAGFGRSQRGDGEATQADFVMGRDIGRGSILFTFSYYDRAAQPMAGRDWSGDADWSPIGGPNRRHGFGSPPTLFRYDTLSFEHDPACGSDPLVSSVRPSPAGGTVCGFNFPQYQDQFPSLERIGATLSGRYQISPGLSAFGDALYSDTRSLGRQAPQGIAGSGLVQTWTGAPLVPAGHPGNPFGVEGELLSRLLGEGARLHQNEATAWRIVAGLEGTRGDWAWRLSGSGSQNEVTKTFGNLVFRSRYQQALLGAGGPQGDQWYNPFGYRPENEPDLVNWLTTDAVQRDRSVERSVDLLFTRPLGMLGGGPVGVAIGLQYRQQELDQWADDPLLSGDLGYSHEPVTADRDIAAAYLEFDLPLLERLEAQLALRYEDYSDFGSTTHPKVALRWQPLAELMLRASWSTSFKPPSFYEMYQPVQQDTSWYRDVERCERTGLPEDCRTRSYPAQWGGNPDLEPEEGESWFTGLLWTPEGLSGFELQLDFWRFRHEERIEWLDAQLVLDAKGDFGIIRAPAEADGTPGRIVQINEARINADTLLTSGFDTTLRYALQTAGAGGFRLSMAHTYVDRWEFTESLDSGLVNANFAGRYGRVAVPRNRANLNLSWNRGPHGAAANLHYAGHYENHTTRYVDGEQTDEPMIIPSHTTVDIQYNLRIERLRDAVLRVGCNNIADRDPPLNYGALEPLHDGRGRYFYIRWQQPIR
jgi:outer membrane receptor protein involved in Fe transport